MDSNERARLSYVYDQGPHVFSMRKDSLSVGRGGSAAWVDVQVMTTAKVSREHFRIRRDAAGVVEELAISTAPVVLGGGKRLFEGFEQDLDLEVLGTWSSPYATHVRYAVKRGE